MNGFEFLTCDEDIQEVEIAEVETGEACISLVVGDETAQFEVVLTRTQLEKMVDLLRDPIEKLKPRIICPECQSTDTEKHDKDYCLCHECGRIWEVGYAKDK